jgi:hypothetical protein
MLRQRGRVKVLGLLVASLALSGVAKADISTERSGSILVFPKVIADSTRDTIIQITNTSNQMVRAHCFYVNAALANPDLPQGPLNQPLWLEVDFDITLTKQQPTYWSVTQGREVNPTDPPCDPNTQDCFNAGFDPGRVPPVVPDFVGELKCIEVDEGNKPLNGNHLKGEATLVSLGTGDISKYNALAVPGLENNGDDILVLGGGQCTGPGDRNGDICGSDEDCGDSAPCAFEYDACPQTWILNHQPDGAPDLVLGPDSRVSTDLTVIPCTQNYETQIPTSVTLQFLTWNDYESQFSFSTTITCWADLDLGDLGATQYTFDGQFPNPLGSSFLQTRIRAAAGTPFGVMMVAEEFRRQTPDPVPQELQRAASFNLVIEGQRPNPDIITIPAEQLEP